MIKDPYIKSFPSRGLSLVQTDQVERSDGEAQRRPKVKFFFKMTSFRKCEVVEALMATVLIRWEGYIVEGLSGASWKQS